MTASVSTSISHSSNALSQSSSKQSANVKGNDLVNGKRCNNCVFITAGIISGLSALLFGCLTVASIAATIAAGVTGAGAPAIIPGVFSTFIFAALTGSAIALTVYNFKQL